ncbi:MAG: hypothetical protein ACRD1R_17220 [Acidobacteriota bacterium]
MFDPDKLILSRLVKELQNVERVVLGPGIPQLAVPHLSAQTRAYKLGNGALGPVDLAVVEAAEISAQGDLVISENIPLNNLQARKWIVATRHTSGAGEPKIVRSCRLPVSRPHCVELIISELGVIRINEVGLVLEEVAPGVASDDVKRAVAASLHVSDDIALMI